MPLSLIGTFWLLYVLGYNLSIAVWVGIIALAGLSAETGVVMLLYLDRACDAAREQGRLRTLAELRGALFDGAARRVRPVVMLSATTALGLLPIMWSTGTGGRRDEADRGADGGRGGDDGRRRPARVPRRLLHLAGVGPAPRERGSHSDELSAAFMKRGFKEASPLIRASISSRSSKNSLDEG